MTLPRLFETPAGIRIGPAEIVREGMARNFVLEIKGQRFHGFAVRRDGEIYGYVDACPHMGPPLAKTLDDYLAPDRQLIMCGWHGALFEIETGLCVGGPCMGTKLKPWPLRLISGSIETL